MLEAERRVVKAGAVLGAIEHVVGEGERVAHCGPVYRKQYEHGHCARDHLHDQRADAPRLQADVA